MQWISDKKKYTIYRAEMSKSDNFVIFYAASAIPWK